MSEQRCGNCRWWRSLCDIDQTGDCTAPLPASVHESEDAKVWMFPEQGQSCPCWQEKEKQP